VSANAPEILTPAYYGRLDELERRHWWCRSVRRRALAWVGTLKRDAVVLDAGCGTGGFLASLVKEGFSGCAIGLDLAAEALAWASRDNGIRRLARGSASELPIAAASVDLLVLHDVVQHLSFGQDEKALAEAFRVLKPGGALLLRTNVGRPIDGSTALHRRYGAGRLASVVRSAGFAIERHRLLHPALALVGMLRARRSRAAGLGAAGLATTVPPEAINRALDLFERLSDAVVSRLPSRLLIGDVQPLLGRKPSLARSSGRRIEPYPWRRSLP